jgi:hypothetical protein
MEQQPLKAATVDQIKAARIQAIAFIKSTNNYQSARSTATCAVMEYILYLQGITPQEIV